MEELKAKMVLAKIHSERLGFRGMSYCITEEEDSSDENFYGGIIGDEKAKLKLALAAIRAGNDSDKLKQDVSDLLDILLLSGEINNKTASKILSSIIKQ